MTIEKDGARPAAAAPTNVCPRCGEAFSCGMEAGVETCWCTAYPAGVVVPDAAVGGCYCPACLAELIDQQRAQAGGMYCRPLRPPRPR